MWYNIDKARKDSSHYSVMAKEKGVTGMDALRAIFPEAAANSLNFVLFSTSGVHGTSNTIEEAERALAGERDEDGEELCSEVTFLIVHPRLVSLRYGVCDPYNSGDIEYLKKLRQSSFEVMNKIGVPD